jgi:phosphatidylinositol glycan class Q protein
MHPFSVLTLGIFVAGYITARWDLVTRLYELAIFAWENGVVVSTALCALQLQCLANTCSDARDKGLCCPNHSLPRRVRSHRTAGHSRNESGTPRPRSMPMRGEG